MRRHARIFRAAERSACLLSRRHTFRHGEGRRCAARGATPHTSASGARTEPSSMSRRSSHASAVGSPRRSLTPKWPCCGGGLLCCERVRDRLCRPPNNASAPDALVAKRHRAAIRRRHLACAHTGDWMATRPLWPISRRDTAGQPRVRPRPGPGCTGEPRRPCHPKSPGE